MITDSHHGFSTQLVVFATHKDAHHDPEFYVSWRHSCLQLLETQHLAPIDENRVCGVVTLHLVEEPDLRHLRVHVAKAMFNKAVESIDEIHVDFVVSF